MAGSSYTSDQLLASIRRRGALPDSSESIAADDSLYALINEELQTYCVEVLRDVDEEFLVATEDLSVVAGTASYAIPSRAIGRGLRGLWYTDSDDTSYRELSEISLDREHDGLDGYKFEGDVITLIPTPTGSATLRVRYFRRPAKVVTTAEVATISAIDTTTGVVTLSATIPATFTAAQTYDFVGAKPGFASKAIDLTASAASGTGMTFDPDDLPSNLAVGDYVCLADESPVPQIPVEMHPLLAQRVVFKALEALGDQKAVVARAVLEEMRARVIGILTPRNDGAAKYIVNRYGPGFSWSTRRGRRY